MPSEIHHRFSPSQLWRFANCPGSYKLRQLVPRSTSPEADRGTDLHARIISGDLTGLSVADAESITRCREIVAQESEGAIEVRQDWHGEVLAPDRGVTLTAGTLDFAVRHDDGWHLYDWKCGTGEPPPYEAVIPQLSGYALALFQDSGFPVAAAEAFHPASGTHLRIPIIALWTVTELAEVVAECEAPGLSLCTGPWCRYCGADAICQAAELDRRLIVAPPREPTTPNEIAEALTVVERYDYAKQAVDARVSALRERAIALLTAGTEIPGWTLKPGRKRMECPDLNAAHAVWLAGGGTTPEFMGALSGPSLPTLAEAEQARTGLSLAASRRAVNDRLGPCLTETRDKPRLARIGTTREIET
jgi:hypothetical protein